MRQRGILFFALSLLSTMALAGELSVPGHLEPHHKILFQNGYVRILEARLAPGKKTLPHSHALDAAVVFLTEATFQIEDDDGSTRTSTAARNSVRFSTGGVVHTARNAGIQTSLVIRVELFSLPPARPHSRKQVQLDEILLENDKVQITRVRLAAEEILSAPSSAPMVIIGTANSSLLSLDGQEEHSFRRGGILWREPGESDLRTRALERFEAIVIQLKTRG